MQASSGVEAYLMARLEPGLKAWLGFAGALLQGANVLHDAVCDLFHAHSMGNRNPLGKTGTLQTLLASYFCLL